MDNSISFGEVEEAQPEVHPRPDQNYHFAVVPVGAVDGQDLPIYIDIDTVLDIESHALVDTDIELGGVLLGGQYVDDQGQSFVLVRDSLRAEDYEATKSSFKFTHETWAKIARQKDRFPAGTEIVGWYHTHPDWGVFLSGMDMFICNGFFNRPLDVALVVDPCRDDRGWFHWVDEEGESRKRRTSGFYLFGSRFREQELQATAEALLHKEGQPMVTQQRFAPTSQQSPVVHVHQPDQKWIGLAILSMLLLQTVLVAVVALAFLGRSDKEQDPEATAYRNVLLSMMPADQDPANFDQRLESLVQKQKQVDQWDAKVAALTRGAEAFQKENERLDTELAQQKATNQELTTKQIQIEDELKGLRQYREQTSQFMLEGEKEHLISWWSNWVNLLVVGIVAVAVFVGGMLTAGQFKSNWDDDSDEERD